MSAARGSKSTGKSPRKRSKATKRVREERADAFRHGINTTLLIVLILLLVFGAYYIWNFLGKPGWPQPPRIDRSVCLELYFYDTAVTYLVPVHRRVTLAPGDSPTTRAVEEFASGPRDPYLARVYPDDIPVPAVRKDGHTAIVDLPREIMSHFGGTTRERALLDALTLIVAAAGECTSVRILIAGEAVEATPEGYDLTEPLIPPEFFNHVPDSSLQGESKWVTAFFLDSSGRYLIPLSLEVSADVEDGDEAMERLLRNPPQLSYPPPLPVCPPGYTLERLIIENGVATVDLAVPDVQTAFLDRDIDLFRRAAYLTLKQCCDVTDVSLLLNGLEAQSYSRFGSLQPLPGNDCWNLEREPQEILQVETSPVEGDL